MVTTDRTMRHVTHNPSGGGPETMGFAEAPMPVPRPGELLIEVEAAGVNRPDVMQRAGKYPPPPGASPILGLEVAGRVVALGPPGDRPSRFQVGDRVCALVNGGGYATFCVAPVGQCLPCPAGLDVVQSAALPETCFTVWSNLFRTGRLRSGETVLIHGATSGIGSIAIQLATQFGARVFATCGDARKAEITRSLGAEAAINYKEEDFAERVAALTEGRGVDVVLDIVGAAYLERNLRSLADLGRLVLVSVQSGAVASGVDLARIMSKRLTLTGTTLRPRTAAFKAELADSLAEHVWPLIEAGKVKPLMERVLPFEQVRQAHELMEGGSHAGKIVLDLRREERAA
ncbi:NAD(P)H-quinone oxidoreductase [Acetobacteraceae bacterium KSS8]|uniref:NAD(P)H-quinone oxidoreductase n=1 Tax=Endosaccharibacter trunci TaxID=2812733 RepID=A0ABT1W855_9PROT|nr:NAD(P)H-quinone oxidoreductase [Acetobacteraceae bacterium KSS8]